MKFDIQEFYPFIIKELLGHADVFTSIPADVFELVD